MTDFEEWPIWKPFRWLGAAIVAYYGVLLAIGIPVALVVAFFRKFILVDHWDISVIVIIAVIVVARYVKGSFNKRSLIRSHVNEVLRQSVLTHSFNKLEEECYSAVRKMEREKGLVLNHEDEREIVSSLMKRLTK